MFTTFALLPHTVALTGVSVFGYLDGAPFPGWNASQMHELAWGRDAPAGRRAVCRIQFRDARGGGGSRAGMVDRRFPDMVDRVLSKRDRWTRRVKTVAATWRWRREQTTAVAITLLLGNDELPRLTAEPELALVEHCVGLMNTYLTSIGMASNDPLIGGLALADLATPVDFVFELHAPNGLRAWVKDQLGIHLWDERVLALPREDEKLTAAAELFRASRGGASPPTPSTLCARKRFARCSPDGATTRSCSQRSRSRHSSRRTHEDLERPRSARRRAAERARRAVRAAASSHARPPVPCRARARRRHAGVGGRLLRGT
jgi:hypothetical protein